MRFLLRSLVALAAALMLLTGCAAIPTDPHGTLARVRATGVLRAGASPSAPWVLLEPGRPPGGSEPALVEAFASQQGARVDWTTGGEEELIRRLDDGALDLVVGGLTTDSPWETKSALTRAYTESTDAKGRTHRHVMAVRMGENALQSALERFLDEAVAS